MSNGPPENADLWRARLNSVLDEHYVVGVQEHFAEAVKLFAGSWLERLIAQQAGQHSPPPRARRRGDPGADRGLQLARRRDSRRGTRGGSKQRRRPVEPLASPRALPTRPSPAPLPCPPHPLDPRFLFRFGFAFFLRPGLDSSPSDPPRLRPRFGPFALTPLAFFSSAVRVRSSTTCSTTSAPFASEPVPFTPSSSSKPGSPPFGRRPRLLPFGL